jgi:hypothetical protein
MSDEMGNQNQDCMICGKPLGHDDPDADEMPEGVVSFPTSRIGFVVSEDRRQVSFYLSVDTCFGCENSERIIKISSTAKCSVFGSDRDFNRYLLRTYKALNAKASVQFPLPLETIRSVITESS